MQPGYTLIFDVENVIGFSHWRLALKNVIDPISAYCSAVTDADGRGT